MLQNYKHIWG